MEMEMAGYSLTEVMLPTQKDQKQCTRSENRRFMFVAASAIVVATVGLFIGGFFTGRAYAPTQFIVVPTNHSISSPSPSSSFNTQAPVTIQVTCQDKTSVVNFIPGNTPVQDFQESTPVLSNVTSTSPLGYVYQTMNPALNIPGGLIVTFYQSNLGDMSIILSATGSQYSTNTTNNTIEAKFNVSFTGLIGNMDESNFLPGTLSKNYEIFNIPFAVGATQSSQHTITNVKINPTFYASCLVTSSMGSFNVYVFGSSLVPILMGTTSPGQASSLVMQVATSVALAPVPATSNPTLITNISDSTIKFYQPADPSTRRSDSTQSTPENHVLAAEILDPVTGQRSHRVEFHQAIGSRMGIRVNVTRYSPLESHAFTMYSGNNIQLGSTNMTATPDKSTKHVVQESYQNGVQSNFSVIQNGKPMKHMVGSVQAYPAWVSTVMTTVQESARQKKAAYAVPNNISRRRGVSFSCIYNILNTVYGTAQCASDVCTAIGCDGLCIWSDFSSVVDCWGAVQDWMSLGKQCGWSWWHL